MIEHQTRSSMRHVALAAALSLVVGLAASPVWAESADAWTVVELGGEVSQRGTDGSWQTLVRGTALADGAWLRIGTDGKLVLSHRKDTITAAPGSEFQLPHDSSAAGGF